MVAAPGRVEIRVTTSSGEIAINRARRRRWSSMRVRLGQPAAADVDEGDDLVGAGIDQPVVAAIRATSCLGLLIGPVFDLGTPLLSPAVGMKSLDDEHGDR